MKWSWRIARVAGIGIYMHWTFLLLLGWLVLIHWTKEESMALAIEGVVFVLAIFGCVILHELGHALTARRFGIRTRDITLLPIGGVARLERMPEDPTQELLVAAAGPAVNVVIAAVLFAMLQVVESFSAATRGPEVGGSFIGNLMWVNLFLVGFNLLPAFPMDGGRVLRAILAQRLDYVRATQVAASIGQGMAILFAIAGVLGGNLFLILIGLFVYMGAEEEAQLVKMRYVFRNVPVRSAMITRFRTLNQTDPLSLAVDELLAGSQHDFPVVADGRIVGMLLRHDLIRALAEGGRDRAVASVMRSDCGQIDDTEMVERAFARMSEINCHTLPVLHAGHIIGIITLENIGEWMMIQSAIEQTAPPRVSRLRPSTAQ